MIRKNILKQNIKRYSAGFIFALSLFSLVGVGFSSWITSENNSKNININIYSDNVKGINVTFFDIGMFPYAKIGTIENGAISRFGDILFSFKLEGLNAFMAKFDTDKILINPSLVNKGAFNILNYVTTNINYEFKNTGVPSKNSSILKANIAYATLEANKNYIELQSSLIIAPTYDYIYGAFLYRFDFSSIGSFENVIYNNMNQCALQLTLKIE